MRAFGVPQGLIPGSGLDGPDLATDLRGFRPDVIVAYVVDSPAAWKGARAAGRLGVPLILVEEGFPNRGRTFGRFLRHLGERLWGSLVERRASSILALDPVARRQLLERGFEAERIHVIPPGLDLSRYRPGLTSHLPAAHGIRGRILLVCAHLRAEVGLDRIVRAFADTVGSGGAWSLVFSGEGPAGASLRAQASRRGVGAQVHWLHSVRRDELAGLFGAATLLLAPSDPLDVPGWRLRRALACGLPVVAERFEGVETIVEPDGCGLVVGDPPTEGGGEGSADADAWAAALRRATSGPERRRRWSRRARELAEASYAWPRVAERFEALLFAALEEEEGSLLVEPAS